MTNPKKIEIICIIDRSGSMSDMMPEAQNSFNHFVEKQKELPGEVFITLAHFDDEYELVWNAMPVKSAPQYTLIPRNMTALLDAIGKTINDVGTRLEKTPESDRPGKVIVLILTDGLENASQEFKSDRVGQLIEEQRTKYNWEFMYLGANQDAFAVGKTMRLHANCSRNFKSSGHGINLAYAVANQAINVYATNTSTTNPHGLSVADVKDDEALKSFGGTPKSKLP